jgi:hypothetical protein
LYHYVKTALIWQIHPTYWIQIYLVWFFIKKNITKINLKTNLINPDDSKSKSEKTQGWMMWNLAQLANEPMVRNITWSPDNLNIWYDQSSLFFTGLLNNYLFLNFDNLNNKSEKKIFIFLLINKKNEFWVVGRNNILLLFKLESS